MLIIKRPVLFHHPLTSTSNEERFLEDFFVFLLGTFQNYLKNVQNIFQRYFIYTVMYITCSNIQPHNSVLPVAK